MRRFLPWLVLFFPALELWVIIQVGREVGALAAIGLLILSTLIGLAILWLHGFAVARNMQAELNAGNVPSTALVDTFCLMASGALFVFPGFVSDLLALLLLIPFVRHTLFDAFISRIRTSGFAHFSAGGMSATSWTCTTHTGQDAQTPDAHVIIDCEPESPTAAGGSAIPLPPADGQPTSGTSGNRRTTTDGSSPDKGR